MNNQSPFGFVLDSTGNSLSFGKLGFTYSCGWALIVISLLLFSLISEF